MKNQSELIRHCQNCGVPFRVKRVEKVATIYRCGKCKGVRQRPNTPSPKWDTTGAVVSQSG